MSVSRSAPRAILASLLLLVLATGSAFADGGSGLYVNSPSSSGNLAAGLANPAAWVIQGSGGRLLGIEQPKDYEEFGDLNWTGINSFRNMAFSVQSFSLGDGERYQDYTLGFGGGNRNDAFGVSYNWKGIDGVEDRWNLGAIHRGRAWSVGLGSDFDKKGTNANYHADMGIRPFGPRLTLFGEGRYVPGINDDGEDEYEFHGAFGAEVFAIAGLSINGKMTDDETFSLGIRFSFDEYGETERLGAVTHFGKDADDAYELASTTYLFEAGRKASVLPFSIQGEKYPEIHLKGRMPYQRFAWFDDGRTFLGVMKMLNYYAENPRTQGVVINMSSFRADPEMMLELRDQLAGLRAAGKKVVIYIDRVNQFSYMLASVADELWIDPLGSINIPGFAFGGTYMADALDKIGVGFQEFRYFRFKSAAETLSRTDFSDGQREQLQSLMDDWYETTVEYILASRDMDRATWDRAVEDYAGLMPDEALELGFVDKIGDYNDMKDAIDEIEMRTSPDLTATYMAGLYGDPVWRDEVWGERDRIALLYAIGVCSMDSGIKGRLLSKEIRKVREDKRVKAVVLRADSPGGDPLPSDLVSRELKLTMEKKPVIITQGFMAASGGYWISMHSDKILASPLTITGSIGVISGHVYNDGLGEKLGLSYDQVKIGSHSDLSHGIRLPLLGTVPHRPYDEKELDRVEYGIKALYNDFMGEVAEGRGMTVEEVSEVAQGRIWSGTAGLGNGLVDELGGLWMALQMAKDAAGIDEDDCVTIVEGPSKGKFDLSFLAPKLIGMDADELAAMRDPLYGMSTKHRAYIEALQNADGRPLLLMEPFDIIDGATVY